MNIATNHFLSPTLRPNHLSPTYTGIAPVSPLDGFAGVMPAYGFGPDLGGIFENFLGGYCPCAHHSQMAAQGQMMMQVLALMAGLMQMLGAGASGNFPFQGQPNFGSGQQLGPASALPNSGSAPVGPSNPSGPRPSGPATPSTSGASPVKIGPGTRVLEIGDSHSVGTFGKELDRKLRGTGAQVSTYASAGASASTFVKGTPTKYGYWEKRADGSQVTANYGQSKATPKLDNLIAREKPHVIIVNLGANFRGGNPKSQVDQLGQIAKKHNIPIVWVGPPKTAKDNANPSSLQSFDQKMAAAVAPYGTYVPSTPHTSRYSGGDGLHYNGTQGTQIAKQWASGVFRTITG